MHVRLAFSVMVQVDADVLLIDEVLAVGDAAFQQKCFDVFDRLSDEGKTIVLVTHDMAAVQRFCHRAMLLERGELVDDRRPGAVGRPLPASSTSSASERGAAGRGGRPMTLREGDGSARIVEAWLEDDDAASGAARSRQGSVTRLEPAVRRAHARSSDPIFGVVLQQREAATRSSPRRATDQRARRGATSAGDEVEFGSSSRTRSRPAATSSRRRSPAGPARDIDRPRARSGVVPRRQPARGRRHGRPAPRVARRARGRARATADGVVTTVDAPPPPSADRGPVRAGRRFKRFLLLTRTLAITDFKLRFFGSALGYFWQLLRPLMLFGVLYVVFTRSSRSATGQVLPGRAARSTSSCSRSSPRPRSARSTLVVDREAIVRKIHFPRLVDPARGRAHGVVQPGAQRVVVLDLRARVRRHAAVDLALAIPLLLGCW